MNFIREDPRGAAYKELKWDKEYELARSNISEESAL